jgi:hypothetical protein
MAIDLVTMQKTAEVIFNSSGVLLAVGMVLIATCWKDFKKMYSVLPAAQRDIKIDLRKVNDNREKVKEQIKLSLPLGIICFSIMIFLNVASMLLVARTMLGVHGGVLGGQSFVYELWDYSLGKELVFWTVGLLFLGLIFISFFKISEFIAIRRGKVNFIAYMYSEPESPDSPPIDKSPKKESDSNPLSN